MTPHRASLAMHSPLAVYLVFDLVVITGPQCDMNLLVPGNYDRLRPHRVVQF